jgi:hypothetical protein
LVSTKTRKLLGADVGAAAVEIAATERVAGAERVGSLPMWIDLDGRLRIALRRPDPAAVEVDQIIVEPGALLRGLGIALERKAARG